EAEADDAAGAKVVGVVVEYPAIAGGDEIDQVWKGAFLHGCLEIGPGLDLLQALSAAKLGQEDVPFRAQPGQLLFERPHPRPELLDPAPELVGVELHEILRHPGYCRQMPVPLDFHVHPSTSEYLEGSLGSYLPDLEHHFRMEMRVRTVEEMAADFEGLRGVLLAWDAETFSGRPAVTNDFVVSVCRRYPDRFIPFGSV